MKRLQLLLLVVVVMAFVSTSAFAQKAGVIGTVHDVSGAGCATCHLPHNGSDTTGAFPTVYNDPTTLSLQNTGKILLWDRAFTSVTFGVYDSPTLDSPATEVGTTTPLATDARLYSFLCMSCHDGVTSPSLSLLGVGPTDPASVGNVANSAGLTNDHPVNMAYDPVADTGLAAIATVNTAGLELFGGTNTVQCATCHDPHNDTNTPFLRVSNTGSALCLTCHL